MTTPTKILAKIYKANQCTDLNDVNYAIAETRKAISRFGWTSTLSRRLRSLKSKENKLKEKTNGRNTESGSPA